MLGTSAEDRPGGWHELVRYASGPLLGAAMLAWVLWPIVPPNTPRTPGARRYFVHWENRLRVGLALFVLAPVVGLVLARRRGDRSGARARRASWVQQGWVPPVSVAAASIGVSLLAGWLGHQGFFDRCVDELAYRFQARTLALGRLVNPVHPAAAFFECPQIIHHGVWASKYFPGHALLLVPGVWLGTIHLVPVLCGGATSAMVYVLARRWVPRGWAWTAGLLWAVAPVARRTYPGVMTQSTSTLLCLVCLWAYLKTLDRDTKRWWALVGGAWALGWLVRPFSALVTSLPIGLHVLERLTTPRLQWRIARRAAVAAGFMAIGVGLLFAYSHRVTGRWWQAPWARYAELYTPMDTLGFNAEASGNWRPRVPVGKPGMDHAILMRRWKVSHRSFLTPWRFQQRVAWGLGSSMDLVLLVVFVPWAFTHPRRTGLVIMAAAVVCTLLGYLYFHFRASPYYYAEISPLWVLLAVVGIHRWQERGGPMRARAGAALLVGAVVFSLVSGLPYDVRGARADTAYRAWFADALERSVPGRAVVLVRHNREHQFVDCVVDNPPDLGARVLVGIDRGPANEQLRALFPDRRIYLVVEPAEPGVEWRRIALDVPKERN